MKKEIKMHALKKKFYVLKFMRANFILIFIKLYGFPMYFLFDGRKCKYYLYMLCHNFLII